MSSTDSEILKRQTQAEALVQKLRQEPLISEILDRLSRELPDDLHYHAAGHTEDVLHEAILFSVIDGLKEAETQLVAIAAAYHDAGFLNRPVDNEKIGATMARDAMTAAGRFTPEEISLVERMILDTKLVRTQHGPQQIATTPLSKYLLDADLSNFGRPDFFEKGELFLKECGSEKDIFLSRVYNLVQAHNWQSEAAKHLRQPQKQENVRRLKGLLKVFAATDLHVESLTMSLERLGFLAKLPLLLNSDLEVQRVIGLAVDELKSRLEAEAATIFIQSEGVEELTFWTSTGGDGKRLAGKKMPAGKGIVGWVIEHKEPLLIHDVQRDPRFFTVIDKEGSFKTRNMICVPMFVRGDTCIGAIQVLNKCDSGQFSNEDLLFVEQFGSQVALAVDNGRLFTELSDRNRALETLDRRRSEMIAMIAHEFRTPLNVIQTSADMLISGLAKDQASREKVTATLMRGVQRLAKLAGSIKEVSLVSAETLNIDRTSFDVAQLIGQLESQFKGPTERRKLKFEVVKPPADLKADGDPTMILVVLKNLLANAIRFTGDGGRVWLRVNRSSGMAEFEVEDTGIGIDAAQIPLIFEKFYEVTDAMQHSSGEYEFKSCGLGLGLASVKSILKAHGSEVKISSKLGKGSKFSFCLPIV